MAKRVFFSFHYEDVKSFRANVVRKSWVCQPERSDAGFIDASIWEAAKKEGDLALKRLINSELQYTSVTCALIGSETYLRPWVRYELLKSFDKGNGLLGVHINSINDKNNMTKSLGINPFEYIGIEVNPTGNGGRFIERIGDKWYYFDKFPNCNNRTFPRNIWGQSHMLSYWANVYDWSNNGYNNFATWVARALCK